jgi:hypothetical protein
MPHFTSPTARFGRRKGKYLALLTLLIALPADGTESRTTLDAAVRLSDCRDAPRLTPENVKPDYRLRPATVDFDRLSRAPGSPRAPGRPICRPEPLYSISRHEGVEILEIESSLGLLMCAGIRPQATLSEARLRIPRRFRRVEL